MVVISTKRKKNTMIVDHDRRSRSNFECVLTMINGEVLVLDAF